ncbi:phospholipase A and acyltransferase 1-like [Prinia subflava]|uniref:phospholipase A and acyltransferase 1-like n=1 Tax=Prinia subflava TaxID=208062 RepID=UPI002FDFD340
MEWDNCNPQPGDLIEIDRVLYQHWALYVGDGYLIHVTDVGSKGAITPVGSGSNLTGNAKVKKEVVKDVVKNHKWRVNNKYDRSRTPLPVEEIIQNAESLVGLEIPYNLFKNNCEHFVTLLRYDDKFCDQVSDTG